MTASNPRVYTAEQVAARFGIHPSRVRKLAQVRGVGSKLGRAWMFTEADVRAMQVRVNGRPRKQEGKQ